MTLVEVMIAMVLGLLVTLAITSLFLSQRESYRQNEEMARMQENARFAIELMIQDLRHAGFFGSISQPLEIDTSRAPTTTNNCAGGIFTFNTPSSLLVYANNYSDPDASATLADCVASSEINTGGSSILIIKRSQATPSTDSEVANRLYTYANGSAAQLFTTTDTYSLANGESWEYQPRVYFLDDDGTLNRKFMSDATGTLTNEPLAEGIEAFHIEFGIDTDNDGTADYYYAPGDDELSDTTLDSAVSATVYILARTPREDRNYSDGSKTYQLGIASPMNLGPFNDGFHRRVYHMSTALKNIRNQVMLQGS